MTGIAHRYDRFQKVAVHAIEADFRDQPAGRFLLVIPTGGGKTFTAVKAVSALFDNGHLTSEDRVPWVVHREELRTQAEATFRSFALATNRPNLPNSIDFLMVSGVREYLSRNPSTRLAVIDEAHHVAAASYQPLFAQPQLGILGLTATPSRHDGRPLQFTKESFSIGFPDLIELGVLLRPKVIRIDGGRYEIDDIDSDTDALEAFNNSGRNGRILEALTSHQAKLNKVLIYVGTKQHARDLFTLLTKSPLAQSYESIGLILGGERRRFVVQDGTQRVEDRQTFIKEMKATQRSILVNVDVLSEGYDDPTVNAVVMARPTNSKLVYMQAMGRAVRQDPEDPDKSAFVLEVVDELPNIRYRIDNRWLFSDVSDQLEPAVNDETYPAPAVLAAHIETVFGRFGVPKRLRALPTLTSRDRVTLLLFRVFTADGSPQHLPIVITNATRQTASNFFNFLSARMHQYTGLAVEQVLSPVRASLLNFPTLALEADRACMLQAMENAWEAVSMGADAQPSVGDGHPWITFVTFQLSLTDLPADLFTFTDDMLNAEAVRDMLRAQAYADGSVLCRFPLPLKGSWGVFLASSEFESVRVTVEELRPYSCVAEAVGQWRSATHVLGTATLPIASHHHPALATIVRENLDYFRILSR